jgi:hypothetical protein
MSKISMKKKTIFGMAETTITNYLKHLVPSRLDKRYTSQKVCDKSSTLGRKTRTVLQFDSSGSEL